MLLGWWKKDSWQGVARELAAGRPGERLQRRLLDLEPVELANCLAAAGPGLPAGARRALAEWLDRQELLGGLLALLAQGEVAERALAAEALGWAGGPAALQPLLQVLAGREEAVTFAAARALGVLETAGVAECLTRMLLEGEGLPARVAQALVMRGEEAVEAVLLAYPGAGETGRLLLIQVLAELASPRALEVLLAALAEGTPAQRAAAAGALGRLGNPASIPALRDALRDAQWEVRCQAAQALGLLRAGAARTELAAALADAHHGVRAAAREALELLGGEKERRDFSG